MPATEPGEPAGVPTLPVGVPAGGSRLRRVARRVLRGWIRTQVRGAAHLPATGPVLLASTHRSHGDSLALGVALTRDLRFLGDRRLLGWPVVGRWLPRLGMVPLDRGAGDAGALETLAGLLASGEAVVVYPEGTRSRDGRVHRLRSGVARLAAATQVPVVPAAVVGIETVWPVGRRPRLRGGRVLIRLGPALAPPADDPRSRRAFNTTLQAALAELAGAPQAERFAPLRGGD